MPIDTVEVPRTLDASSEALRPWQTGPSGRASLTLRACRRGAQATELEQFERDLEALFALDCACFSEIYRFSRAMLRRLVAAANSITWLAECGGRIVGFAIAEVRGRGGYLQTLDVAANFRRAGIAGTLLRATEASLLAAGADRLDLHVSVGNEAALNFYRRNGFSNRGQIRQYYGPEGGDALRMRKKLLPPDELALTSGSATTSTAC